MVKLSISLYQNIDNLFCVAINFILLKIHITTGGWSDGYSSATKLAPGNTDDTVRDLNLMKCLQWWNSPD